MMLQKEFLNGPQVQDGLEMLYDATVVPRYYQAVFFSSLKSLWTGTWGRMGVGESARVSTHGAGGSGRDDKEQETETHGLVYGDDGERSVSCLLVCGDDQRHQVWSDQADSPRLCGDTHTCHASHHD